MPTRVASTEASMLPWKFPRKLTWRPVEVASKEVAFTEARKLPQLEVASTEASTEVSGGADGSCFRGSFHGNLHGNFHGFSFHGRFRGNFRGSFHYFCGNRSCPELPRKLPWKLLPWKVPRKFPSTLPRKLPLDASTKVSTEVSTAMEARKLPSTSTKKTDTFVVHRTLRK